MTGLSWLLLVPLGAGTGLVVWLATCLREPVLAGNRRDWLTQKTRLITWRRRLRRTRAHHAELDRLRDDAEADRRQLLARLGHARQEAAAWRESAESLIVQVARLTAERDALTSEHDALISDTAAATLAAQRAERASKEAEARSLPALVGSPALCLDLTAGWADSVMSDAEWAALLAPRAEHDGVPARVTDGGGQLAGEGGDRCDSGVAAGSEEPVPATTSTDGGEVRAVEPGSETSSAHLPARTPHMRGDAQGRVSGDGQDRRPAGVRSLEAEPCPPAAEKGEPPVPAGSSWQETGLPTAPTSDGPEPSGPIAAPPMLGAGGEARGVEEATPARLPARNGPERDRAGDAERPDAAATSPATVPGSSGEDSQRVAERGRAAVLPARTTRQRARDALLAEMTSRLSAGEAESRGQATPDDPPASAGDGSPSQSPAASQAGTPEDPPKQGDDGVPQDGEHHPPAVLATSPAAHPSTIERG